MIPPLTAWLSDARLLAWLSTALMRVLNTDSLAAARLHELEGRVIALQVTGSRSILYAALANGNLILATDAMREPDVTLTGRIADFAAYAQARGNAQAAPAGKLQIEGDLATAQATQRLLDDLAIDWEALLATRIGDLAAHQVGRGVRRGLAWLREARAAWAEDIPAYLQQERHWVPTGEEVEALTRDGMALLSDVDRLAARVARLRERRSR